MKISQGPGEKKILVKGLEINYRIQGEGRPLLILHGWGSSSNSWIKIQKILAGQGFKVIVPDFPGFGKSGTPRIPWNIDDYIEWLKNFIGETKIKTPLFLLGHSFGGRIAIKFTVKYPQKIKYQILLASAGIKSVPTVKQKIFFRLAQFGNHLFSKKPLRRFKSSTQQIFYQIIRQMDYLKVNQVMRETIKKVLIEDLLDFLPKIKRKTLIVWGKQDKVIPIKYAHTMKEKIPDSQLIVLPDSGHSLQLDNPEKLVKVITRFLRS